MPQLLRAHFRIDSALSERAEDSGSSWIVQGGVQSSTGVRADRLLLHLALDVGMVTDELDDLECSVDVFFRRGRSVVPVRQHPRSMNRWSR